jgi:DNA-binding CsgD family transcriptional regulator
VLEAVSIAVPHAELSLLDAMGEHSVDAIERCLGSGILHAVADGVAFRHELARMAFEESLSPHRRRALHRRALAALTTLDGGADLARLAHHADAAGDAEPVLVYATAAAEHAASSGAYRESAAQYMRALRFGGRLPAARRADLLEACSYACYLTDQIDASIDTLQMAIELRRADGDPLGEGAALSTLSRRLGCGARGADAEKAGREAVRLLEELPPGRELALAYSNLAQVFLNDEQPGQTLDWARRALDIAGRLDDTAVIVHSLNNIGTMQLLTGQPQGWASLQRSLHLAEQAGLEEHIGRAYIHFGWAMTRTRAYETACLFDRGLTRCEDLGLEGWKLHLQAYQARFLLDSGRWDRASDSAAWLLQAAESVPLLRITALTILGLVRARRGDGEVWPPLDEAVALMQGQDELQYLAPVAAARAEAAWLAGDNHRVDDTTAQAMAAAVRRRAGHVIGELAWLRRLAGITETVPCTGHYALQLAGDVTAAAKHWTDRGCAYDAALALVGSDDEHALRQALDRFQRLDARPASAIAARRLRELGVRSVPRGPRRTTSSNPANLTRREVEVLALIQRNASNAEIATKLCLSEKTVHHHVTAILRKLGVSNRRQASAKATLLGITERTPAR